tara:strand:- start:12538 stop:12783 length:246 start_codon:yes stop_codon:yes gene_type:complete
MSNTEKVFANGFSFKRREGAPDFVIGQQSIKVDEAIAFLKENQKNGWVNLNVNKARSGKLYVELDTFEPKKKEEVSDGIDF